MTTKISERVISPDRAVGALWGAAIGDALGWPIERLDRRLDQGARKAIQPQISFQHWKRRSGSRFHAYEEVIRPGEYSDDTQLLIATARSLLRGSRWSVYLAGQELPIWLLYERGAGTSIKRAARSWQHNKSPWNNSPKVAKSYFATGANGAAMRVLPHALVPHLSITEMHTQVMLNSALTHGHPRALLGAMLYTQAARFMVDKSDTLAFGELVEYLLETPQEWSQMRPWAHGYKNWLDAAQKNYAGEYEKLWQKTVEELILGLQLCHSAVQEGVLSESMDFLRKIGGLDKRTNGAGTVSALAAIYFSSLYAAAPVTGLLEAAFAIGADTDTIASMVGGLLGALLGTEWIAPEWREVQDKEYLSGLAHQLIKADVYNNRERNENGFMRWQAKDSEELLNQLMGISKNQRVNLGPLGQAEAVKKSRYRPIVHRWQHLGWELKSIDGQTIYITKTMQASEKNKPTFEEPPQVAARTQVMAIATFLRDISDVIPSSIAPEAALQMAADTVLFLENDRQQMGEEKFFTGLSTEHYIDQVAQKIQKKHNLVTQQAQKEIICKFAKNMSHTRV